MKVLEIGQQETAETSGGQRLRSFVNRIERLDEEVRALNDDKRDVYAEARGEGYDVKALKEVIKLRKKDPAERSEHEALVDTYMSALGEA